MSQSFDLIIANGMVFTPGGPIATNVGVRAGRIAAFGVPTSADAHDRLEAGGLTVLPGVIDEQVHFREPGPTHKEDLESGTRGAVLGGVTAVFEMPNTDPATTTAPLLMEKVARAKGRAWTDFAFYIGASPENADELGTLERLPGCCGIKMFMGSSTGSLPVSCVAATGALPSTAKTTCACRSAPAWCKAVVIQRFTRSGAMSRRRSVPPSV
jgi:dihydroorotase